MEAFHGRPSSSLGNDIEGQDRHGPIPTPDAGSMGILPVPGRAGSPSYRSKGLGEKG